MTSSANIRFVDEARYLLLLASPIIVSQLAQLGINFVDTVMAGRHSDTSLAGVAIGSSLWVPCFLLLMGILMAVTPMVAQAWGANNKTDIRQSVQQAMWLALVLGVTMMLVLQWLLVLFDFIPMDESAREQAKGYVFAASFGLPAMAFFQVLRGLNDGLHHTRPFMYVSLLALLANIPLNYIFVYGKLGLPEMGGVGCGWATAVVLWMQMFALYWLTMRNVQIKEINWQKEWGRPQRVKQIELLKLGLPIGIGWLIESSMFVFIALFLAQLGNAVVAGHQVAMSFISLLFMVPLSLAMALTIRCGFYVGQGQLHRAAYVGWMGIGFAFFCAIFYCLFILAFRAEISSLYSNNAEVIAIAVQLLFLAAIFQISDGIQVSAAGALRGYKDTRFAFFVVLLAYWVIGLPLGYLLGLTSWLGEPLGAKGFWMGLIAGLSLAALLLAGRFWFISKLTSKQPATS